jgi:hypothetical protein
MWGLSTISVWELPDKTIVFIARKTLTIPGEFRIRNAVWDEYLQLASAEWNAELKWMIWRQYLSL